MQIWETCTCNVDTKYPKPFFLAWGEGGYGIVYKSEDGSTQDVDHRRWIDLDRTAVHDEEKALVEIIMDSFGFQHARLATTERHPPADRSEHDEWTRIRNVVNMSGEELASAWDAMK